jgi:hypothetical protein
MEFIKTFSSALSAPSAVKNRFLRMELLRKPPEGPG